ncbi:hypothetical protein SAMN05446037_104426 [Anaerovirgula multivorans]|uniref:Uncharacterized protein n=1 Tax=Anaerovirgula multivorans TaxID=312168 RepID=A0A239K9C9_9FIRM|nr:hypothetical protein [Anaerovirgula multivorans]SNT14348.1 hypothetical protein SAMN05446037_104426 [Anaerovirgula multivorans]
MVNLYEDGVYLINGNDIITDPHNASILLKSKLNDNIPTRNEAAKNTIG